MKIRIISDNTSWSEFVTKTLAAHEITTEDPADLYLVSARQMVNLPQPAIVFTDQPIAVEAIAAYRAGALDYQAMDFNPEILLSVIEAVREPVLQFAHGAVAKGMKK